MAQFRNRTLALLAALACVVGGLRAQIETPVTWTFATEVSGDSTFAVFRAAIDDGWSVYSQYLESDEGPVATEIVYATDGDARVLGPGREAGERKAGFDELFGMNVVKFAHDYTIRVPVDLSDGEPLTGYLVFMTCDDTKCLPPTDVDFAIAPPPPAEPASSATPAGDETGEAAPPTRSAGSIRSTGDGAAPTAPDPTPIAEAASEPTTATPALPSVDDEDPVRWSFLVEPVANTADAYDLLLTAAIAPGWTVYAQDVAPGGPVPTSFTFAEAAGVERIGSPVAAGERKAGFDPFFELDVAKYLAPSVTWRQRVRLADASAEVLGILEYMTCDDERCLPPTEVAFRFRPAAGVAEALTFDAYDALVAGEGGGAAAGLPGDAPADTNAGYAIDKELEDATCGIAQRGVAVRAGDSLLAIFLLGMGGGLLALLTPCVFPMIPLTVSFFTAQGTKRARGLRRALGYGASIIGIYVSLGLVITAVFGADAIARRFGWTA